MISSASAVLRIAFAAAVILIATGSDRSQAGPDPYLGEIVTVGFNFCPRGYAPANGQLLSIEKNLALFSLYGTTYGGNGKETFALPDLRGRSPVHAGQGPGLPAFEHGQKGGKSILSVAPGDRKLSAGRPYLVLSYCVALQGVYPSRD